MIIIIIFNSSHTEVRLCLPCYPLCFRQLILEANALFCSVIIVRRHRVSQGLRFLLDDDESLFL